MLRHEAISLWKWLTTTLWYMWNRRMTKYKIKICIKCGNTLGNDCKCDPSMSLMQKILEDCNRWWWKD